MRYRRYIVWVIFLCLLFSYFQIKQRYLLFYEEQQQLFLFSSSFSEQILLRPAGLADYLSRFLTQFYYLPYLGAFISALLLTLCGLFTQKSLLKAVGEEGLPYAISAGLAMIPVVCLLFLHLDVNYITSGTIAYLMTALAVCPYLSVKSFVTRGIIGVVLFPLLYFLVGSMVLIGCIYILLGDIMNKKGRAIISILSLTTVILTGWLCIRFSLSGGIGEAFKAEIYYDRFAHPLKLFYPWVAVVLCLIIAFVIGKSNLRIRKDTPWLYLFPVIVATAAFFIVNKFDNSEAFRQNLRQDYYLQQERWADIINTFRPEAANLYSINVLNLALCKNGEDDKIFSYPQQGVKGLVAPWDNTTFGSIVLSDICYHIGDIASARKYAFEGYVSSIRGGNVRLLRRLIETNIISGDYKVAEKYITLLEKTLFHKDTAHKLRRYLNDEAVSSDSIFNSKRLAFRGGDTGSYAVSEFMPATLEQLAQNNPKETIAVKYLSLFYLLAKDKKQIHRLINTYYGTEILPKLSLSLQEAAIATGFGDFKYLVSHGVSVDTERRYRRMSLFIDLHSEEPDFEKNFMRDYGSSYWYYLLTARRK